MGFKLLKPPAVEPVTLAEMKAFARFTSTAEDELFTSLISAARNEAEAYTRRAFITQQWRMYLDAFPGYIDQRLGGNIVTAPIAIGATSYMAGIRWAIVPPKPRVQSIDGLSFIGPNGDPVTMTPDVDYLVDTISEPARVTPPFGKFWPISRIQTNSVWIDWTTGFGGPIVVSIANASKDLSGYTFKKSDVGRAISIPGAGGGSPVVALNTTIATVDGSGNATTADAASSTATSITAWLGDQVPDQVKTAIKMIVMNLWQYREGNDTSQSKPMSFGVERLLYPYRDLRF